MKYLITGFQAFGADLLNPTEVLLQLIREDSSLNENFETQLLPVEYESAYKLVLQRNDLSSFAGIFAFGMAGGRTKICLERVALNWNESRQPDNAGKIPALAPIELDKERAFFTPMNLEILKTQFEKAGLPVEISLSAGGYVCNHFYFHLLKENLNAVFIHVPYLQEQVATKPNGTPFITREDLKKILNVLVQSLRTN